MAMVITNAVNKKPILTLYGANKLVAYTVWLEVPFYKLPEFERSGYASPKIKQLSDSAKARFRIEVADGHITWTTSFLALCSCPVIVEISH